MLFSWLVEYLLLLTCFNKWVKLTKFKIGPLTNNKCTQSLFMYSCLFKHSTSLYINTLVYYDEYFRLPHLREPKINNAEISTYLSKHFKLITLIIFKLLKLFIYCDENVRLPHLREPIKIKCRINHIFWILN